MVSKTTSTYRSTSCGESGGERGGVVGEGRSQRRGHLSRDLVEVDVWERTVQEEGADSTKVLRQCVGPLGLP